MAGVEQRFGEMGADEPGSAGDERSHWSCPSVRRSTVRGSKACTAAATSSTWSAVSPGWSGSESISSHDARGNRAVGRIERGQRRLLRDRHRVVNQRFDAARGKVRLQLAPCRVPDDEQMVDVPGVAFRRRVDRAAREPLRGTAPPAPAAVGPAAKARQPRAENRRLQIVEPRVDARLDVMIAVGLAAVAQPLDRVGERAIAGDDGAAVAERAEVLGRVEAERAGDADRADRPSAARREMRLAAVLDDREVVSRGDRFDRGHVGRLAVEVHRQDRARLRTDRGFNLARVDRQPHRIDVGEHRARAGHHDRERGVGRGQRRRDHFVAGADAERAQDQRDRVGAGADADRVRGAGGGGELLLERLDLRPEHEPAARDHAIDRGAHVGRIVFRHQRHEGDARLGHHARREVSQHLP